MTVDLFKERFGYEIEGVWFPRVTSITSPMQKKWWGMRKAAEWGTLIHETVEAMLRGENVSPDAKCAVAIETFLRWQSEYPLRISDPINDIETRVWDLEYGYAGTIDIVAEVEGVRGIIDLKTSTAVVKEHFLQTAAYLHAYNKTRGESRPCQTRWILRIDQYQECKGCLAKLRIKYGSLSVSGGKSANWRICNHQWGAAKGEIEFQELKEYERDLEQFFDLKERWEWTNREWLAKIPNYEKNIRQHIPV